MTVPNPWEVLDELDDVVLVRAPITERGRYYHRLRTIVVRSGLLLVQERATLWHELHHARNGDRPCSTPDLEGKQEERCHREAARAAIPMAALLDVSRWARSIEEAADHLKTTPEMLRLRLKHLHPSERHAVGRVIAAREDPA